jgi:thioredoxin:protein disulfide reductase
MTFKRCLLCVSAALVLACGSLLWAQMGQVLTVAPPARIIAARGSVVSARLSVRVQPGYHVNSNTPNDNYLIPLRLSWGDSPLEVREIIYPQPRMQNFSFSTKPVSVFAGDFEIVCRFAVPAGAPIGTRFLPGKLRYQACNDSSCLPPKVLEVKLPVEIRAQ